MPDFITMAAIATGATTANMPAAATTARGCWSRNWRRMGNSLHTLLAAIAIVSSLLGTLYASERTVRCRSADRLRMLDWSRCGSGDGHWRPRCWFIWPDGRRRSLSRSSRVISRSTYRRRHWVVICSAIAPVAATIRAHGTWMIIGAPDGRLIIIALTRRLVPPISWTRMIAAPVNNIAVPPIKVAIQPTTNRKAEAKRNERRAIRGVVINLVRLIDWHIDYLGIRRNDFNVATVIDYLLLRRGLQVTKIICRCAQPLDGTHHLRLLIEKSLSQFRRPVQVVIHPSQNTGIAGHGLDASVPRLLVNLVGVAAARDIAVGQDDLRGQGGRRQDFGNQRVGIKRNPPQQLVQLRGG